MKSTLNEWVFRTYLNFFRDDSLLISPDNLFHDLGGGGIALLNVQSTYGLNQNTATHLQYSILPESSRWLSDWDRFTQVFKYHVIVNNNL